jgi:hypothetical protein
VALGREADGSVQIQAEERLVAKPLHVVKASRDRATESNRNMNAPPRMLTIAAMARA